jgi:hypothetical protein
MVRLFVLCAVLTGCIDPVDQRWELDHDHVVAVRATPPHIASGRATLDALVAHEGMPARVEAPIGAADTLEMDDPLHGLVGHDLFSWYVAAPAAERLAAARVQLGLAADAPVPLTVVMAFGTADKPMYATKTVYFGDAAENPSAPPMAIDGQPAADQILVPMEQDVYVTVNVEPGSRVNWLTSCGELFQDDVATAFLRVKSDARTDGQLAVVIRDPRGGVAWRVWPVHAAR